METKSSNAPVVVIALAVVVIVAMICGMVIWLMQRSMAMNERLNDRLLDVRLQEAKALSAQAAQPPEVPLPVDPKMAQALADIQNRLKQAEALAKREAEARRKAESQIAAMKQNTPVQPTTPVPEAKPATPPVKETPVTTKPAKPQVAPRKAPQETPASAQRVGSDGYPVNRITLPMGNDELDWQL